MRPWHRFPAGRTLLTATAVALAAAGGCHQGAVMSLAGEPGGGPSPDAGSLSAAEASAPAPPPQGFGDAPGAGSRDGGAPASTCAEESHTAEHVPLDLMLLVDRSGSMLGPKWMMSRDALTAFVGDPRSAGLGVGLQFFPRAEDADIPCATDTDCGIAFATPPACSEYRICLGPVMPGATLPPRCPTPPAAPCAAGSPCVPLGRCPGGAVYCTNIGAACPGGGTCVALGKTCATSDFSESCQAAVFNHVSVEIGPLPATQPALARALAVTNPSGGTPMLQAVQGTMVYLKAYLAAHPGHRMVLVVATDGVPSLCGVGGGTPIQSLVTELTAARMLSSSIATYAIGVFSPAEGMAGPDAVNQLAAAGGTGPAFVLNPGNDLNMKLLDSLNQIRGAALPCEFNIPPPKMGVTGIDYGKVNVHFKGTGGEEDILFVGQASKCDPARGGWYYDSDPAAGTPQHVVTCDATCRRFKADPSAQVALGFGCLTRVIQ